MKGVSFPATLVWLFVMNLCSCGKADDPSLVKTKSGFISGKLIEVEPGLQVYQYTGIPFAQPPIGNLRFRKPVPIEPWGETVFRATGNPNACMQIPDLTRPDVKGFVNLTEVVPSEDCLFLNIWVPKAALDALKQHKPFELLSVFNLITSGHFRWRSINLYDGSVLAAYNNIIVTSVQNRLGSLGFAYFGTKDSPGNLGLWDQLEAMKWIYENIGVFGGNNYKITLEGMSSGAASVTMHMLSPYSKKYFSGAIVESGSALSPWLILSSETGKALTDVIFQTLAPKTCNATGLLPADPTPEQKLACLQAIPADLFPQVDDMPYLLGYGTSFLPIIDGDFIPKAPLELLMAGEFNRVPLLVGVSKDEGSTFVKQTPVGSTMLPTLENPDRSVDDLTYNDFLALNQGILTVGGPYFRRIPQVVDLISYQYWPRNHEGFPRGVDIPQVATEFVTDASVLCPTYSWAQLASNFIPVYAFYFTYRRDGHASPEWMGVTHGSLEPFALGEPFLQGVESYDYNCDDNDISRVVMAYYSNFVKYGNPNGQARGSDLEVPYSDLKLREWPQYVNAKCNFTYFEINYETVVEQSREAVICGLKARNCLFWGSLVPKLAA